jgi:hypothetical protein
MADGLSWLADGSEESVRAALRALARALGTARSMLLRERPITSNPDYWQGSAVIDDSYLVKFAWSEVPARRLVHEATMLEALRRLKPDLPMPRVEVCSAQPVLLVTRKVPGISLPSGTPGTYVENVVTRVQQFFGEVEL